MNPKYIYERLGSVPNIVKLKVWDIFRPKRSLDLALKSVTLFFETVNLLCLLHTSIYNNYSIVKFIKLSSLESSQYFQSCSALYQSKNTDFGSRRSSDLVQQG